MTGAAVAAWLVRWGHVAAAAVWVGGWAALALGVLPWLRQRPSTEVAGIAALLVRGLSWAGTATVFFGILLVGRSRGWETVGTGEWGWLILASLAVAVALLGVGDGAVRPALRRVPAPGAAGRAWALSLLALALCLLALGLMTRAVYAGS